MMQTDKTYASKPIAYEILDDGYMIYLDGKPWIKQRGDYGKPMDASKSYEENCLLQIEDITKPVEKTYTLDEAAELLVQEVNA